MKFEDKLQSLRKKSNLSQEALAQELGVSRQAVSKWESGSSYPEMDKLIMMSKIFKCSLDDLVNDSVTDKQVIETEENKKTGYIDSVINFIIKSVNMFCSMKFSSLFKCLLEMFIVGSILVFISFLLGALVYSIFFDFVPVSAGFIYIIVSFIYNVFIVILIIVDFIIFYQVYKVRYLNYYNQISYAKNQTKEYEGKEEAQEKINEESKRIKLNNNADRIIIRDPKDRPIKIFSFLSKIIMAVVKAFVLMFGVFLLIGIFFLIVILGISFYLIFVNKIFIGITLCELCLSVLGIYFLIILIKFLFNKKVKVMPFIITLISCVVIGGLSVAGILLSFRDFEIIKRKHETITESVKIKYNDNLVVTTLDWYNINYEIDENLKDIVVDYTYYKDIEKVTYSDDSNTYHFGFYQITDNSYEIKIINEMISNLKNNRIIVDDYQDVFGITVRGNSSNIKSIIKNSSMKKHVTYFKDNGLNYIVNYEGRVGNNNHCTLNKMGYYDCYDVQNNSSCNIELTNFGLVYDRDSCYCHKDGEYTYYCYNFYE